VRQAAARQRQRQRQRQRRLMRRPQCVVTQARNGAAGPRFSFLFLCPAAGRGIHPISGPRRRDLACGTGQQGQTFVFLRMFVFIRFACAKWDEGEGGGGPGDSAGCRCGAGGFGRAPPCRKG
jgi:hypothetical protein